MHLANVVKRLLLSKGTRVATRCLGGRFKGCHFKEKVTVVFKDAIALKSAFGINQLLHFGKVIEPPALSL